MRVLPLLIMMLCSVFLMQAQDKPKKQKKEKPTPVNGWELKEELPADKRVKEVRQEKLMELKDKQSEHFNMPQGKWYFGLRGGWATPLLTVNRRNIEDYLGTSDYFENSLGEISNKTVVTNDGGGFKGAVYAGYQFNQFVSAEVDLSFNEHGESLQGRIESPLYNSELITRGRSIAINPSIVLSSPNLGNVKIFGKFGLYMPLWVDAKGVASIDDRNGTFLKSIATERTGNFIEIVDVLVQGLGANVDGLEFLEDGVFHALGYYYRYEGEADVDFRIDQHAIGFSGSLGLAYQISPLISILGEVKVGGNGITAKSYSVDNINARLDIAGERDVLVINEDGAILYGNQMIPAEELNWLFDVNYEYEIDETSNNSVTNPNGIDRSKPTDRVAIRRSIYDFGFNVSLQFNFKGKKE